MNYRTRFAFLLIFLSCYLNDLALKLVGKRVKVRWLGNELC